MKQYIDSSGGARTIQYRIAWIGLIFLCSVVVGRLWQLQVWQASQYHSKSQQQIWRSLEITAQRGRLFDRNGQSLVINRGDFELQVRRTWKGQPIALLDQLGLSNTQTELAEKFFALRRKTVGDWITVVPHITYEQMAIVEAKGHAHPLLRARQVPRRNYIQDGSASHLLGYLSEISPRELERLKEQDKDDTKGFRAGSIVGKSGIEETYEMTLAGSPGKRLVRVDAFGRVKERGKETRPVPGEDLYLTIDAQLQQLATELLKDKRGVIVALDAQTGGVLALENSPSFDLRQVSEGVESQQWAALLQDPLTPLENRAIRGQYPPGSTYKAFTALAALTHRVTTPHESVFCPGSMRVGRRSFRCWKKGGHGAVNLKKAIAQSCDVYFYEMALRLGPDKIAEMARRFGFGQKTGIEISGEKSGLIPTRDWKLRRLKEPWQAGETVIIAIGQGFNLVTPLQLARAYASLANGGHLVKVHTGLAVSSPTDHTRRTVAVTETTKIDIDPKHLELVKDGLFAAVNGVGSTGGWSRVRGTTVAGKTGTAQVVRQENPEDSKDAPEHLRDHAWFAGYAPADDPKIVVVALIEHGGHGGSAAAPLVGKMIKQYLFGGVVADATRSGHSG